MGEKAALLRISSLTKWVQNAVQAMVEGEVAGSGMVGPLVLANCQGMLKLEPVSFE